ncbi:hypothetical protein ACE1AT_14190 [Pelatocladus sp. BLCC-F211]|uniref:hypothetical protein n=1 Tax=Pelatocladus sp. BLCC-F211 TaxID=3342752 RepID=UPI0035BA8113
MKSYLNSPWSILNDIEQFYTNEYVIITSLSSGLSLPARVIPFWILDYPAGSRSASTRLWILD